MWSHWRSHSGEVKLEEGTCALYTCQAEYNLAIVKIESYDVGWSSSTYLSPQLVTPLASQTGHLSMGGLSSNKALSPSLVFNISSNTMACDIIPTQVIRYIAMEGICLIYSIVEVIYFLNYQVIHDSTLTRSWRPVE